MPVVQPKKGISFQGDGKWETYAALRKYRKKRDARNKAQKRARARNRR